MPPPTPRIYEQPLALCGRRDVLLVANSVCGLEGDHVALDLTSALYWLCDLDLH